MKKIQKCIGVCPQFDILFDKLTPKEHLKFYARIKGIDSDMYKTQIDQILIDLDLKVKENAHAGDLSGNYFA